VKPPFTLVGDTISHDTLEAIDQLRALALAKRRRLIGVAFVGMTMGPDGRHYFTNAAGECYRNPTFARGMVTDLLDALGELSRGQTPHGWEP